MNLIKSYILVLLMMASSPVWSQQESDNQRKTYRVILGKLVDRLGKSVDTNTSSKIHMTDESSSYFTISNLIDKGIDSAQMVSEQNRLDSLEAVRRAMRDMPDNAFLLKVVRIGELDQDSLKQSAKNSTIDRAELSNEPVSRLSNVEEEPVKGEIIGYMAGDSYEASLYEATQPKTAKRKGYSTAAMKAASDAGMKAAMEREPEDVIYHGQPPILPVPGANQPTSDFFFIQSYISAIGKQSLRLDQEPSTAEVEQAIQKSLAESQGIPESNLIKTTNTAVEVEEPLNLRGRNTGELEEPKFSAPSIGKLSSQNKNKRGRRSGAEIARVEEETEIAESTDKEKGFTAVRMNRAKRVGTMSVKPKRGDRYTKSISGDSENSYFKTNNAPQALAHHKLKTFSGLTPPSEVKPVRKEKATYKPIGRQNRAPRAKEPKQVEESKPIQKPFKEINRAPIPPKPSKAKDEKESNNKLTSLSESEIRRLKRIKSKLNSQDAPGINPTLKPRTASVKGVAIPEQPATEKLSKKELDNSYKNDWSADKVLGIKVGRRPNPWLYHKSSYLSKFKEIFQAAGVVIIQTSDEALTTQEYLVFSKEYFDQAVQKYFKQPEKLASSFGIKTYLYRRSTIYWVEQPNSDLLQFTDGNEKAIRDTWYPGGFINKKIPVMKYYIDTTKQQKEPVKLCSNGCL